MFLWLTLWQTVWSIVHLTILNNRFCFSSDLFIFSFVIACLISHLKNLLLVGHWSNVCLCRVRSLIKATFCIFLNGLSWEYLHILLRRDYVIKHVFLSNVYFVIASWQFKPWLFKIIVLKQRNYYSQLFQIIMSHFDALLIDNLYRKSKTNTMQLTSFCLKYSFLLKYKFPERTEETVLEKM